MTKSFSGVKPSPEAVGVGPEAVGLTHGNLEQAVGELAHQIATLQNILAANDTKLGQLCQERYGVQIRGSPSKGVHISSITSLA